jgi:hypothetical protein
MRLNISLTVEQFSGVRLPERRSRHRCFSYFADGKSWVGKDCHIAVVNNNGPLAM